MAAFDLIVIGAGPAGAAAARAARAGGLSVLLLERGRWPRRKACTGVLSAAALAAAEERFGPTPPEALARPALLRELRVHLGPEERYTARLSWPALRVERKAFDAHLVQRSGADLRAHAPVRDLVTKGDEVEVQLQGAPSLLARMVVVAAGAGTTLAPVRGVRLGLAFASRVHYKARGRVEGRELLLLGDPSDGLAVIDPDVEGLLAVTTALKDPRRWKAAQATALKFAQHELKLQIEVEREAEFGWLARGGPWLGAGRVLLAGDAAGLALALGLGLEAALESGEAAGQAAVAALRDGARDAAATYKQLLKPLLRRRQAERRLHSLLRARVGGFDGQRDLGPSLEGAPLARRGVLGLRLAQVLQALDQEGAPPAKFPV
ncbi:MAG: NAD(P)/FAD-dependent oxidoreductase [Planctomycetota bacterium]